MNDALLLEFFVGFFRGELFGGFDGIFYGMFGGLAVHGDAHVVLAAALVALNMDFFSRLLGDGVDTSPASTIQYRGFMGY